MQDFLKQFTLIDFMAMFIPGGSMVLIINYTGICPLKDYCTDFFGSNSVTLVFYFCILSYLVGTIFSECSKLLEKMPCWKQSGGQYLRDTPNNEVQSEQRKQLRRLLCGENDRYRTPEEAYEHVKVVVQGKRSYKKRLLFSAFYEMSRTFLIVIPILAILLAVNKKSTFIPPATTASPSVHSPCIAIIIYIIAVIGVVYLLYRRSKRFQQLAIVYAYQDYQLEVNLNLECEGRVTGKEKVEETL